MKKIVYTLGIIALSFSANAGAQAKCQKQRMAFTQAQAAFNRAQNAVDQADRILTSRSEQAEFRRTALESNIAQAQGNLDAAKASAIGQGFNCIITGVLTTNPKCIGPSGNVIAKQIGMAVGRVNAAQDKLKAFNTATATQLNRFADQLKKAQDKLVIADTKLQAADAAYSQCQG